MKINTNHLIRTGHYTISIPILALYAISFYAFGLNAVSMVITTAIAWGYWSISIPKWKLESLKNLNTTHEFFEWNSKAIWNGLIWPEHSIMNKTEIWSGKDRLEYNKLKDDFLNPQANSEK